MSIVLCERGLRAHVRRVSVTCGVVLLCSSASAPAQSLGGLPPGYQEYLAILGTPIASLPPYATHTLIGVAQNSPQLVARYGYVADIDRPLAPAAGGHDARSLGSFAATGTFGGLNGSVSITAGVANEKCDACSSAHFMGSIGGDYRLLSTAVDNANVSRLTIGTSGEIGVGFPAGARTLTADVGVPVAFTIGGETGTQIIPFVTPSVAYILTRSWLSNDVQVSAGRLLIGGGATLFNAKSSLGASFGFQYVFVTHTQLQLGVSVSYGGR